MNKFWTDKKYFFSVCAIARDEAEYLPEWLEYHILQGVEHFYLYLNECKDSTLEVILPYREAGLITITDCPGTKCQLSAYSHCLKVCGEESEWLAFLDIDEFVNFDYHSGSSPRDTLKIKQIMEPKLAGIALTWNLFGSSGHFRKPEGLVIENYISWSGKPDKHVKSIVRPEFIKSTGKDPHTFYPKVDYVVTNLQGIVLPLDYAIDSARCDAEPAFFSINHYHTKSMDEYFLRRQRPDVGTGITPSPEWVDEMFRAHDLKGAKEYCVAKWAVQVKEAIKERYANTKTP